MDKATEDMERRDLISHGLEWAIAINKLIAMTAAIGLVLLVLRPAGSMTAKAAENIAEQGMRVLIFFLVEVIILKVWRDRRYCTAAKILKARDQGKDNDNTGESIADPGLVRGFLDMVLLKRFLYTLYPAQMSIALLSCFAQFKFGGVGLDYAGPMLTVVAIQMFAVTAVCHPALGTGGDYREWLKAKPEDSN